MKQLRRRFAIMAIALFALAPCLLFLTGFQATNNFGGPALRVIGGPACLTASSNNLGPIAVQGSPSSNEMDIETILPNYTGADTLGYRFNGDTGNNYRYEWNTMAPGAGATWASCANTAASTDRIKLGCADATTGRIVTAHVSNIAGKFHMARLEGLTDTNSAASQPAFDLGNGGWSGAALINSVTVFTSTNNMGKGTCTTIYGR